MARWTVVNTGGPGIMTVRNTSGEELCIVLRITQEPTPENIATAIREKEAEMAGRNKLLGMEVDA